MVLEVCQEKMKSIIFFGIDKKDMVEVREKMEKRFEDGKTITGTRSSHFIPQSASQNDSFVGIHNFKIPTRVDTGDIAPLSYISCFYNSFGWVGLMNKVDEEQVDVNVQFMHPHGPWKTFNWPQGSDSCYVPIPTTATGRIYRIYDEDYDDKMIAAFAKLHS